MTPEIKVGICYYMNKNNVKKEIVLTMKYVIGVDFGTLSARM